MVRPKNETEDLLLLITKICETSFEQTHTKPLETLEFKLTKRRETISVKPSISIEGSWLIGLSYLGVYNSKIEKRAEVEIFYFCTDFFDEFSSAELKDELDEILSISNITPSHLQHEII